MKNDFGRRSEKDYNNLIINEIMANCEWCGKYFRDGNGYTGGPRWNKRYYCSKKCALEGENNLTSADEAEDNLSFAQRVGRFIKNLIITVIIILGVFIIIGYLS